LVGAWLRRKLREARGDLRGYPTAEGEEQMLERMQLPLQMMGIPHWLIIAGGSLVIVDALGMLMQRKNSEL
jgi:hypothetical protein